MVHGILTGIDEWLDIDNGDAYNMSTEAVLRIVSCNNTGHDQLGAASKGRQQGCVLAECVCCGPTCQFSNDPEVDSVCHIQNMIMMKIVIKPTSASPPRSIQLAAWCCTSTTGYAWQCLMRLSSTNKLGG
jgi:hypothetical protein